MKKTINGMAIRKERAMKKRQQMLELYKQGHTIQEIKKRVKKSNGESYSANSIRVLFYLMNKRS